MICTATSFRRKRHPPEKKPILPVKNIEKKRTLEIVPMNFQGANFSHKEMVVTLFRGRVSMYAAVIAAYGACVSVPRLPGHSPNTFQASVL
jgi:hypothetical protein